MHLDAAYNLARWLTRDNHAAEDVVQDAYCRALKYYQGFRGGPSRPWLLRVVRRAAYDWLAKTRMTRAMAAFDEELHADTSDFSVEDQFLKQVDLEMLRDSVKQLPEPFREVTVLRDLEGLSYQEIAEVIDAPIGTVMSRLSRARKQLQQMLLAQTPTD
ncbi:MAG TPA: sigma-70 family RNA polymerase sigma factor [Gemmatales bacterium]|nr:sigma-70 family RNA polymerase sigma factor [Gemmatales bacterium]